MLDIASPKVTVGTSILALVTSGLYDDPLSLYREYIQNAVDKISADGSQGGEIQVTLDKANRMIEISDNGSGLTYEQCLEELLPIGQSNKHLGRDRGFRGIGRLAGLAFADSVTFLTRTNGSDPLTQVIWQGVDPTDLHNGKSISNNNMQDYFRVERIEEDGMPDHGFIVRVEGIRRNASELLNKQAVREHVAEVCPVPFAKDFPFYEDIKRTFRNSQTPFSLTIRFSDESEPIVRQYGPDITLNKDNADNFIDFEEIHIPCVEDSKDAAVGWIAHSSYLGAIPKSSGIRGIRARVGNLQVGGERVFDQLFEEERFNRWCVGEIYILDWRIMPNARRDYFERNPHLRNMENHLKPICRKISQRCRTSSTARNKQKKLAASMEEAEELYNIAASGFLEPVDAENMMTLALGKLSWVQSEVAGSNNEDRIINQVKDLENQLKELDTKEKVFPVKGISRPEAENYRRIFSIMARAISTPSNARKAMEQACQELDRGAINVTSSPSEEWLSGKD